VRLRTYEREWAARMTKVPGLDNGALLCDF
jgi:hypothetical protein